MTNLLTGLLANVAIIALAISIWSHCRAVPGKLPDTVQRGLFGSLMGICSIGVMLAPVVITDGVFVDLRVVPVTLSGLFGGPLAAAVSLALGAGFRLYTGGQGAIAGSTAIVLAALIGTVANTTMLRRLENHTMLSAVAAMSAIASIVSLLALSPGVLALAKNAALPLGILNFSVIILGGLAILNEQKLRQTLRANLVTRQMIASLPDSLNVKDVKGRFIIANGATAALMHAAGVEELIGKTDFDFYPKPTADGFASVDTDVLNSGNARQLDQITMRRDGSTTHLSTLKVPLKDESGRIIGLITLNHDITERKRADNQLAQMRQYFTDAIENMPDALAMFDAVGTLVFCNDQYRNMFPRTADLRVPGQSYRDILQAAIIRGEFRTLPSSFEINPNSSAQDLLHERHQSQFQLYNGHWIETRTRFTLGGACFLVCSDITEIKQKEVALQQLGAKLEEAANTDGLTGLANRRAFDRSILREVQSAQTRKTALSLLLIDVDRFKAYNDTYGHPEGDLCLLRLANCIQSVTRRSCDLVARYGGEEIAVLLPDTPNSGALRIAEVIRERVRKLEMGHAGSEKGLVTVSIGVSTIGEDEAGITSQQILLRRADEALYNAKARGRDMVRYWSAAASEANVSNLRRLA